MTNNESFKDLFVVTRKQWKKIVVYEYNFKENKDWQQYLNLVERFWTNTKNTYNYKCEKCKQNIVTYLWDLKCPVCEYLYIDDFVFQEQMKWNLSKK